MTITDINLIQKQIENQAFALINPSGLAVEKIFFSLVGNRDYGLFQTITYTLATSRQMTGPKAIALHRQLRAAKEPLKLDNYRVGFWPQKSDWPTMSDENWAEVKSLQVYLTFKQDDKRLISPELRYTLDWTWMKDKAA